MGKISAPLSPPSTDSTSKLQLQRCPSSERPSATWNNCFSNYCGEKKIASVEENGVFFLFFRLRLERKPICLLAPRIHYRGIFSGRFAPRWSQGEFRIRNMGSEHLELEEQGRGRTYIHIDQQRSTVVVLTPCDVMPPLSFTIAVLSVSHFLPFSNGSSGKSTSLPLSCCDDVCDCDCTHVVFVHAYFEVNKRAMAL